MAAGVLGWLLAWALFAFGGTYEWALLPAVIAIAALGLLKRPALAQGDWRALDLALICALAFAAFQLVPLPLGLRNALSPSAADFDQRVALAGVAPPSWGTLSLVPGAWLRGAATFSAAVICFWIARDVGHGRSGRRLVRAIAWMGLVVAVLTVIQPALFADRGIYGFWKIRTPMAHPAGPIISRNHMASWLVLAFSLTAGYFAAHLRTHWTSRSKRVQVLADGRAIWLLAAAAVMTAALFVTQSRAGIIGFSVAVAVGLARAWRRMRTAGRIGILAYTALLLAAAVVWANPDDVLNRFDQTLGANAWGGRPQIWQESVALLRRFWTVGVGLGAFDVVMAAYQTSTHSVLINHAHNEYLHIAAEGGLLLFVPLAVAAVLLVRLIARRLAGDRSPMLHVREGAVAGLSGLAAQSLWETPTLTPAVFFLFAAAAGIAAAPAHERGAGALAEAVD
jgi:O-antigen ligase